MYSVVTNLIFLCHDGFKSSILCVLCVPKYVDPVFQGLFLKFSWNAKAFVIFNWFSHIKLTFIYVISYMSNLSKYLGNFYTKIKHFLA